MIKLIKNFLTIFFRGFVFAGPVFFTIYIFYVFFRWLDHLVPILEWIPGDIPNIPGFGIIFLLLFFWSVGQFSKVDTFKNAFENITLHILKLPILKFLFTSIKDLFSAFNQKESKFTNPVLVKMSSTNVYELGFLVQEDMSVLGVDGLVCVYIPFSFGFMGKTIMVKKTQIVKRLNNEVSSSQVLKFVISGGISGFQKTQKIQKKQAQAKKVTRKKPLKKIQ